MSAASPVVACTQAVMSAPVGVCSPVGARCGPTTLFFPEVACVKGGIVFSVSAYSGAVFKGNDVPSPVVWRDDVLPLIAETIAADVRA